MRHKSRPRGCACGCGPGCVHARLAAAIPLVSSLLSSTARDEGLVIAIADREARLHYVDGDSRARSRAESIGFTAGANWSEAQVGTNAPGRAVARGEAVSIHREEHTRPDVHPFSCSAAPLVDPVTGEVLGALDVTGGDAAADRRTLALVQATAAAAARELRLAGVPVGPPPHTSARLRLVHHGRPCIETGTATHALTDRHAELLATLALEPQGLSADEIGALVYPDGTPPATIRGELLRLRRRLDTIPGAPNLESRPYRLTGPLLIDAVQVTEHLRRGEHDEALELYRGASLTRSEAEPVVDLLRSTSGSLREAMLSDATPETLLRYLDLPEAADDVESWHMALTVLPPRAPQRAIVLTHLEQLDTRLRQAN